MNRKLFAIIMMAMITTIIFSGCGKEKVASDNGANIVQKENASGNLSEKNYDVVLDERSEEARYQYSMDDLSLVDTFSGKKITIGMSKAEIEAITGEPTLVKPTFSVYDGVTIQYAEDGTAGSLVVSGGEFEEDKVTRYLTVRGVGINTDFDDFVKAYGDQYNQGREIEKAEDEQAPAETPANAIRYFKVDGKKVEYLGTVLTHEMESKGIENLYMQDFMFSRNTNKVTAMRVSRLNLVGR